MERSSLLEELPAVAKKQYSELCEHKIQSSETGEDKNLWSFLKVHNMLMFYVGYLVLHNLINLVLLLQVCNDLMSESHEDHIAIHAEWV